MKWAGHVHEWNRRGLMGIPERKRLLKYPDVSGRTTLKWILKPCDCGDEIWSSIRGINVLTS
jgi:hypothetical protein